MPSNVISSPASQLASMQHLNAQKPTGIPGTLVHLLYVASSVLTSSPKLGRCCAEMTSLEQEMLAVLPGCGAWMF